MGLHEAVLPPCFPQAIGLAAMFDTDLVFKVADITSTEARAKYMSIQSVMTGIYTKVLPFGRLYKYFSEIHAGAEVMRLTVRRPLSYRRVRQGICKKACRAVARY